MRRANIESVYEINPRGHGVKEMEDYCSPFSTSKIFDGIIYLQTIIPESEFPALKEASRVVEIETPPVRRA